MSFFVAGGTVPPGSPSYVERAADRELYEALLAGEFCYVLNSRQMGKSSLAVRTIGRLGGAGVQTAFVDLTRLGATGADPERWYVGLLAEIGRALGLRTEAMAYVKDTAAVPAVARLFAFLRDVALPRVEGPLVLMIDEIDAVRSLPFPADDLFAGLRELWNARASDPTLSRLTVCLLGAALPSDLIRDPRRTPFNVGRRIELQDFTPEEAMPFAVAVGGSEKLRRILYWTEGHPFLTQSLCEEATVHPSVSVDALVAGRYLEARARDSDTNLADVGNRLLGRGDPDVSDERRADTLSLYERLLRGKEVLDDEANASVARIKMSGVARLENGLLKPRNEIYRRTFDRRWVRDNMPGQELRRQRKAFWRGALRTAAIATTVVLAIGGLAWRNATLAQIAEIQREKALRDYYAATMQGLDRKQDANDITAIGRTLDSLRDNPSRGWEWDHWNLVGHPAIRTIPAGGTNYTTPALSPDGRTAIMAKQDEVDLFDLERGTSYGRIALPATVKGNWSPVWLRTGELLLFDGLSRLVVVDVRGRRIVRSATLPAGMGFNVLQSNPVGSTFPLTRSESKGWSTALLDTRTLELRPYPAGRPGVVTALVSAGPDGSRVATLDVALSAKGTVVPSVSVRSTKDWHAIRSFDFVPPGTMGFGWSDNSRWLTFSTPDGRVFIVDLLPARPLPRLVHKFARPAYNPVPSGDGRSVLVCAERQAWVLDAETGRTIQRYPEASYAWLFEGGRKLVTSYWDFRVYRVGSVERGYRTRALPPNDYSPWSRIDSLGRIVAFPRDDRGAFALDLRNRTPAIRTSRRGPLDFRGLLRLSIFPTGTVLVDAATGKPLAPRVNYSTQVFAASTLDRQTVVLPYDQRSAAVFSPTESLPKARLPLNGLPCLGAFSPKDRRLALADTRGEVTIFDAANWRPIGRTLAASGAPQAMGFSDDERSVYVVDDQAVNILDASSCQVRCRLVGNSDAVNCAAFHPDGTRVATGAGDGTVRMWDPRDGRELTLLGRHANPVVAVGFIDGGRSLVSLDAKGLVQVWLTRQESER